MSKHRKGWAITLVFTMMMTMFLAACGKTNTTTSPTPAASQAPAATATPAAGTPAPAASAVKIGMVTDVGGVNDNSFNQSAWEGLQAWNKDSSKYLQSKSDADYVTNLNQFVKQNYNLTWGIGFMMGDAVKQVASQNPNSKLAIIDAVVDAPNVASITFKEHEGSYLVGVVAGLMTKSGKIGFVGGAEIPVIKRFEAGFVAGVKAVKPDAKVTINYTGKFDAPDLGKSAAATIFGSGADIIFHAAGQTGDGVFNEGKERKKKDPNVWVIGVDKDQSVTFGNDITLTSMMKRVDQAVRMVSTDLAAGKFKAGITELGLSDNAVGLPEKNPNIPADVLAKVKEYEQKIAKGEIKVPQEPGK